MKPWDPNTDTYFQCGEKVRINELEGLDGASGTIGGLSFDHLVKIYIVILDNPVATPWLPMKEQRAATVPAGFLRPISQESSKC